MNADSAEPVFDDVGDEPIPVSAQYGLRPNDGKEVQDRRVRRVEADEDQTIDDAKPRPHGVSRRKTFTVPENDNLAYMLRPRLEQRTKNAGQ